MISLEIISKKFARNLKKSDVIMRFSDFLMISEKITKVSEQSNEAEMKKVVK